jgi:CheY-like chemotaxis protein
MADAPGPHKPKLLVVDDDPTILRAFERVFRRRYAVTTAPSGAEAIGLLAREPFDVAFVDYSMPGMTGLELVAILEERFPEVARAMLTAYADLPEVAALRDRRVVAVLRKPWETGEVEAAVSRAMKVASMRRAVASLRSQVGGEEP